MTRDEKGMGLARHVATWSKDPSTKVGTAIFDEAGGVMGVGYNGFPRGIADDHRLNKRATKYAIVVHSEINAILFGGMGGHTLYCTMHPCSDCAGPIIQAGIREVVFGGHIDGWSLSCNVAHLMFKEAGVPCRYYRTKEDPSGILS